MEILHLLAGGIFHFAPDLIRLGVGYLQNKETAEESEVAEVAKGAGQVIAETANLFAFVGFRVLFYFTAYSVVGLWIMHVAKLRDLNWTQHEYAILNMIVGFLAMDVIRRSVKAIKR